MRSGQYDQRITVKEKDVTGQDAFGADEYTWTTVATFWAHIRAMQGRELETAQQTWADARFKVIMPWQQTVTSIKREHRITWGTRTLEILDAEDPTSLRREFIMYCREIVE